MELRKYRNLIIKVLQQSSGKKLSAEQVADSLITRIEDVEDIVGTLGPAVEIPSIQTPSIPSLPPPDADVYRKINAEPSEALVERFTVDQLVDFAKNQMPSVLNVQPPGFETPFAIRKFVEQAPGQIGFVRIVYQQETGQMVTDAGQRIGPTLQISTTDERLDADELTVNIQLQANAMYSTVKPVLIPKRAPITSSPGDLRNALGADAGGPIVDPRGMTDQQLASYAAGQQPPEWADRIRDGSASKAWSGMRQRE